MRIAFVGVKRNYSHLHPDYIDFFNRYHLELPYYYARFGGNDVCITHPGDALEHPSMALDGGGRLWMCAEDCFDAYEEFDVVVHWRKWFPELYRPGAVNVINCQDHSFSDEWKAAVLRAYDEGKLYGILCFPTWHRENLFRELASRIPMHRLLSGVTLGVDTEIYAPSPKKDPRTLLWASDPGRGLHLAIELAIRLWTSDRRFKLQVCYPDYVPPQTPIRHPAIEWHGCVQNGPSLWELFNRAGVLPYTSVFKEPSSRAHRQAQSSGCLVLYPPSMGSPSFLIEDEVDGIVSPISGWFEKISLIAGTRRHHDIGLAARSRAERESWENQAAAFNRLFLGDL